MSDQETTEAQPYERSTAEVVELIAGGARLIDVRTAHEHEAARLAGSERIGLEELLDRREEIGKDETVVFYCRVGNRSAYAAGFLLQQGVDAVNLDGGLVEWQRAGRELVTDDGREPFVL